ncbi:MAG: hypothetical protein ABSA69_09455, partial [Verrucomicrobiota bacterium]
MKTLLLMCLIALLLGLPLYLLYWNLFRPVLLQRLKYRLFQCRDELRLLLISGDIGEKEKAYPLVESICNKSISRLDDVDLSVLFSWKVDKRVLMEAQRDLTLIFNSGADVRHQFIHIIATVFGAACANSPGILLMLSPFVVFSVTALW